MNSDQLRQFKVIAELRNITKAAEKLYITQPALSMALSRLEEEVARPLFIRDGRNLTITQDGEKLLEYATIVTNVIDQAQDYFKIEEYAKYIKIYRIGGVSLPLLTEGCYNFMDYRLNCTLIKNQDLPRIVGSGIADIVIADDRYMNLAAHKFVEKIPLYHQKLLLSVEKDSPLAQKAEISVKELEQIPMIGRTSPMGFNNWLSEIKAENHCDFLEEIAIDNMTYFTERHIIRLPYLMGSFGIGTDKGQDYFKERKSIVVKGNYTERDIYLWYNRRNRKDMKPLIERIVKNAKNVDTLDKEAGLI